MVSSDNAHSSLDGGAPLSPVREAEVLESIPSSSELSRSDSRARMRSPSRQSATTPSHLDAASPIFSKAMHRLGRKQALSSRLSPMSVPTKQLERHRHRQARVPTLAPTSVLPATPVRPIAEALRPTLEAVAALVVVAAATPVTTAAGCQLELALIVPSNSSWIPTVPTKRKRKFGCLVFGTDLDSLIESTQAALRTQAHRLWLFRHPRSIPKRPHLQVPKIRPIASRKIKSLK